MNRKDVSKQWFVWFVVAWVLLIETIIFGSALAAMAAMSFSVDQNFVDVLVPLFCGSFFTLGIWITREPRKYA